MPELSAAVRAQRAVSINALKGEGAADLVRCACLFALALQASADPTLRDRLSLLRPASQLDEAKVNSTLALASRFSRLVRGLSLEAPPLETASREEQEATRGMFDLLLRLQTNLFYAHQRCLGIFPTTALLEHSCRPNAMVSLEHGLDASGECTLVVTALEAIRRGEPVCFGYDVRLPPGAGVTERRQHILRELGFLCRCAACKAEAQAGEGGERSTGAGGA